MEWNAQFGTDEPRTAPMQVPCEFCGDHIPTTSHTRPRCAECRTLSHYEQRMLQNARRTADLLQCLVDRLEPHTVERLDDALAMLAAVLTTTD